MEILDIEEVQTAPKTELAPIERAAIALESSKTEQHLMALATKHQSITVVKDKAGRAPQSPAPSCWPWPSSGTQTTRPPRAGSLSAQRKSKACDEQRRISKRSPVLRPHGRAARIDDQRGVQALQYFISTGEIQ